MLCTREDNGLGGVISLYIYIYIHMYIYIYYILIRNREKFEAGGSLTLEISVLIV
jgi:hypothetical protein